MMDRVSDFIESCRFGDVETVSGMVCDDETLADCRAPDKMPVIICATCSHQFEIVQLLLDAGADIEAKDTFYKGTALGFAAWHGWDDIATLLVGRGCDVDGVGEVPSPLALAMDGADGKLAAEGSPGTREGHAAIVALLESRGATVIGRIGE